jgi:hypothetical protein
MELHSKAAELYEQTAKSGCLKTPNTREKIKASCGTFSMQRKLLQQ